MDDSQSSHTQAAGSQAAEPPANGVRRAIPSATVARLPVYLRILESLAAQGVDVASSNDLSDACGVGPAQLRKDLSYLGSHGVRGVGYDTATLAGRIDAELGAGQQCGVVIVGSGNLGRALADYRGFAQRGFAVVALVDADPAVVGRYVAGLKVEAIDRLGEVIARTGADIGVVATPADVAQQVADDLVEAGVRAILSFAPVVLQAPDGVMVRTVDVSVELQILAYHLRGPA